MGGTKELNRKGGDNTFKFVSIAEKLRALRVDPIHQIGQRRLDPQDGETFFFCGLQEWKEMNCTADFTQVVMRIQSLCQSLPQMLHHADDLVRHLAEGMLVPNTMAIEPICEDLREELLPHLTTILTTFVTVLGTQPNEPTFVESIFTSLSFLVKYLVKYIGQDIPAKCFTPLQRLCVAPQPHIRQLAAVPFAYLLRKVNAPDCWHAFFRLGEPLIDGQALSNCHDLFQRTIMQAIVGFKYSLRPGALPVLALYMRFCLLQQTEQIAAAWEEAFFVLYRHAIAQCNDHAGLEAVTHLTQAYLAFECDGVTRARHILHFIEAGFAGTKCPEIRGISYIDHSHDPMTQRLEDCLLLLFQSQFQVLLQSSTQEEELRVVFLRVLLMTLSALMDRTETKGVDERLISLLQLDVRMALALLELVDAEANMHWLLQERLVYQLVCHVSEHGNLDLFLGYLEQRAEHLRFPASLSPEETRRLDDATDRLLQAPFTMDAASRPHAAALLLCHFKSKKASLTPLHSLYESANALTLADYALILRACHFQSFPLHGKVVEKMEAAADQAFTHIGVLHALATLMSERAEIAGAFTNEKITPVLRRQLQAFDGELRYETVRVLSFFQPLSQPYNIMREIEQIKADVYTFREKALHIRRLTKLALQMSTDGSLSDDEHKDMLHFALGLLSVPFKDIWAEATEMVTTLLTQPAWSGPSSVLLRHAMALAFAAAAGSLKAGDEGFLSFSISEGPMQPRTLIPYREAVRLHKAYLQCFIKQQEQLDQNAAHFVHMVLVHIDHIFLPSVTKEDKSLAITFSRHYLETLARVSNLASVKGSSVLRGHLLRFLAYADPEMQTAALTCYFAFHDKLLKPYHDFLTAFVDVAKFREQLTKLTLMMQDGEVDARHRPVLMQIVMRILFGRILYRRNAQGRAVGDMETRRKAVFSFIAGCSTAEMAIFVGLMIQPFLDVEDTLPDRHQQKGFLRVVDAFLDAVAMRADPFLAQLAQYVVPILLHALVEQSEDKEELDARKECRSAAFKCLWRIALLAQEEEQEKLHTLFHSVLEKAILPRIAHFAGENAHMLSSSLLFVSTLVQKKRYCLLVLDRAPLVEALCQFLTIPTTTGDVLDAALASIDKMLFYLEKTEVLSSTFLSAHGGRLLQTCKHFLEHHPMATKKPHYFSQVVQLATRIIRLQSTDGATTLSSMYIAEHLPFLQVVLQGMRKSVGGRVRTEMAMDTLRLSQEMLSSLGRLPAMSEAQRSSILAFFIPLSQLLSHWTDRAIQSTLVKTLAHFVTIDASLAPTLTLLEDVTAYSPKRVDERDFDRLGEAFAAFAPLRSTPHARPTQSWTERQWVPMVHIAFTLMQDEQEAVVRAGALTMLKAFVQTASGEALQGHLQFAVLPMIRKGLTHPERPVRLGWWQLLESVVQTHPTLHPALSQLQLLSGEDEESAIFHNLFHLQSHRRIRAMQRLVQFVTAGQIGIKAAEQYLLPMAFHTIDGKIKEKESNVTMECIHLVGAVVAHLSFSHYKRLFHQRMSKLEAEKEAAAAPKSQQNALSTRKASLRVILAIVNHFHFDGDHSMSDKSESDQEKEEEGADTETAVKEQVYLKDTMAPRLLAYFEPPRSAANASAAKQASDEDALVARLPILMALAKLLTHLTKKEEIDALVPSLITPILVLARSKQFATRKAARQHLCAVLNDLGVQYLSYMLESMRTQLSKGYQRHVLSFNLHALLHHVISSPKVVSRASPAVVQECLATSLPTMEAIVFDDLMGAVAEEKESTEMTGKVTEAKGSKMVDTCRMLGMHLPAQQATGFLKRFLLAIDEHHAATPPHQKTSSALRATLVGIKENKAVSTMDYLLLLYRLMTGQFLSETADARLISTTLMADLAMDVFSHVIKQFRTGASAFPPSPVDNEEEETSEKEEEDEQMEEEVEETVVEEKDTETAIDPVAALDPFVDVLLTHLKSKHPSILSHAAKCFSLLAKYPLPTLEDHIGGLVDLALKTVRREASAGSQLSQQMLRLVVTTMRDHLKSNLTETQVNHLLQLAMRDLATATHYDITFGLIKAVLYRKMQSSSSLLPKVMTTCRELMLTGQTPSLRDQCRQVLQMYLLEYPLTEKALDDQIHFILQNLHFKFATGRQSLCQFLSMVLAHFPLTVLRRHEQMCFIQLVSRLAAEDDRVCQQALQQCLAHLLDSAKEADTLSVFYKVVDMLLSGAAKEAMTTKLFVAHALITFSRARLTPPSASVLQPALVHLYTTSSLSLSEKEAPILSALFQLLLTPHTFVAWPIMEKYLLPTADLAIRVLDAPQGLPRSLPTLALRALHHLVSLESAAMQQLLFAEASPTRRGLFRVVCRLLESKEEEDTAAVDEPEVFVSLLVRVLQLSSLHAPGEAEEAKQPHVAKWIQKFSYLVRQTKSTVKRQCVLEAFSQLIEGMEATLFKGCAPDLISAAYRFETDDSLHGEAAGQLKVDASELMDKIKRIVGDDAWVEQIVQETRKKVDVTRRDRRLARQQLQVTDPEAAARRKLQRSDMKKRARSNHYREETTEDAHMKKKKKH